MSSNKGSFVFLSTRDTEGRIDIMALSDTYGRFQDKVNMLRHMKKGGDYW